MIQENPTTRSLTAITHAKVQIGMIETSRQLVAEELSRLLSDQYMLYTKLRNYHWNVLGLQFKALHDLFAEQYTLVATYVDDTAERIRMLGFFSPGSMEAFLGLGRLSETNHQHGDAIKMLTNLLTDQETLIRFLRTAIGIASDQGDEGTADFLTGLMEGYEKMAWMTRAHLG